MGLERISEKYHEETGLHIDFTRPMTLGDIASWPCWLMWQDILFGHIIIYGPEDLLTAHAPASLREALPELEASRLLLNRGAGLLWALRVTRGVEAPEDSDFVRRNFSKAALSLGDSLLIAYKRHSVSYKGRDKRLRQLAQTESAVQALDLEMLYEEALRFKFRPDAVPSEPNEEALQGLADLWGKVFLQIESKRHLRRWVTLEDYIHWGGLREPEEHMPAKWPRNLARNMQIGLWSWRYPREKLYQRLPVLLGLVAEKPGNWSDASASFLQIWKKMV
jgi:hypothetical protein